MTRLEEIEIDANRLIAKTKEIIKEHSTQMPFEEFCKTELDILYLLERLKTAESALNDIRTHEMAGEYYGTWALSSSIGYFARYENEDSDDEN